MRTTPYHKQLTPEYRKAKRTHKRLRLAKRLGETPEGLLAAGSAVRERFEFGWEPPEDCPKKCGGILVWRSHPDSWKPKPRQGYYFKQWRVCNGCSYVQHQERYKVFVTLKRADTLLAGVQGRLGVYCRARITRMSRTI